MNAAFFDAVRSSLFGGSLNQAQIDGMNAIEKAWGQYGDGDNRKLAYILATAYHETARFKYLREIWGPTSAQKGYEGRADLGNTVAGDGKRFLGRGMVMITGRRNYTDWGKRLGIDLVGNPTLAEQPDIAARILVEGMILGTFTGKALGTYITTHACDYGNARRVVNGTDRAADIAGYADKFAAALPTGTAALAPSAPATPPTSAPADPVTPAPAKSNPAEIAVIGVIVVVLFVLFLILHH